MLCRGCKKKRFGPRGSVTQDNGDNPSVTHESVRNDAADSLETRESNDRPYGFDEGIIQAILRFLRTVVEIQPPPPPPLP